MINWFQDLWASIKLRRFSTEDLLVTIDGLKAVKPSHSLYSEVCKAQLRIARELIRRGEIFW